MKIDQMLSAWSQSENNNELVSAAGQPVVDKTILNQVGGGRAMPSSGYICTVSGECNGTGQSCWPWPF